MLKQREEYDVIVIGGGPIGLSTAYHLSKRKVHVLVLEQFNLANQQGSSAGVSRQFRIPYPEEYMVKLAVQAIPFWGELQLTTPVQLLDKVGTLWFGDPTVKTSEGNINEAKNAMDALKVPYTNLDKKQLEERYRLRNLPDNYIGIFQAQGASVNLRATIETLISWANRSSYIEVKTQMPVSGIAQQGGKFNVTTPSGPYVATKLVLTAGPYANNLFHLLGFHIAATYWNMTSAYYKKNKADIQYPTWFAFQQPIGENGNEFYGFPEVSWDHPGYIRVASDFVIQPLDSPDQRTFIPNAQELVYTASWVRDHMTGLDPVPEFTSTCLVALSTIFNKELLLDFAPAYVPNHKDIVLYATGWAAKFVPLLGKILTDLALDGRTPFDISHFQTGDKYLLPLDNAVVK